MGERANYVVVEDLWISIHYHHWGASSLLDDVFWGSEITLQFVNALPQVEGLLDNTWGEGAVVFDIPRKVILLWNCSEMMFDPVLRRVYLAWLSISWPGWETYWAFHEMEDIARYIGWPLDDVRSGSSAEWTCRADSSPIETRMRRGTNNLITVRWDDYSLADYALGGSISRLLCAGYEALDFLRGNDPIDIQTLAGSESLDGTLFVDIPNRHVYYCIPDVLDSRQEVHFQEHWPEWGVERQYGGFYEHLVRTGRDLEPFLPPLERCISSVSRIILETARLDSDQLRGLQQKLMGLSSGGNVQINPYFTQSDTLKISGSYRRDALERIIASWKQIPNSFVNALLRDDCWPGFRYQRG